MMRRRSLSSDAAQPTNPNPHLCRRPPLSYVPSSSRNASAPSRWVVNT